MGTQLPPNVIATGNSVSPSQRRYSFLAPDDLWILEALTGMLYDYSQQTTWYQVGAVTVEQATEVFAAIYDSFGVDMATTGVIVPYAGGILPIGWLPCDGRSLLRADYSNLFSVIGTTWGAADSAHFNIPDLRGQTLVGQGTAPATGTTYPLAGSGGEETHTLVTAETPSHTHTDSGHTHSYTPPGAAEPVQTGAGVGALPNVVPSVTGSGSASLTNTGGDGAHENRQPWRGVNYAIIT